MPWPDWVGRLTVGEMLTPLLGVLALIVTAYLVRKWVHPIMKRVSDFLDDWQGEAARPGVAARRGFPERLADLEHVVMDTNYNVKSNGGGSAHDEIKRLISAEVDRAKQGACDRVETLLSGMQSIETRLTSIEGDIADSITDRQQLHELLNTIVESEEAP